MFLPVPFDEPRGCEAEKEAVGKITERFLTFPEHPRGQTSMSRSLRKLVMLMWSRSQKRPTATSLFRKANKHLLKLPPSKRYEAMEYHPTNREIERRLLSHTPHHESREFCFLVWKQATTSHKNIDTLKQIWIFKVFFFSVSTDSPAVPIWDQDSFPVALYWSAVLNVDRAGLCWNVSPSWQHVDQEIALNCHSSSESPRSHEMAGLVWRAGRSRNSW